MHNYSTYEFIGMYTFNKKLKIYSKVEWRTVIVKTMLIILLYQTTQKKFTFIFFKLLFMNSNLAVVSLHSQQTVHARTEWESLTGHWNQSVLLDFGLRWSNLTTIKLLLHAPNYTNDQYASIWCYDRWYLQQTESIRPDSNIRTGSCKKP